MLDCFEYGFGGCVGVLQFLPHGGGDFGYGGALGVVGEFAVLLLVLRVRVGGVGRRRVGWVHRVAVGGLDELFALWEVGLVWVWMVGG